MIWVVEIWFGGKWNPTISVGLNREGGRRRLEDWHLRCETDQFRLRPYQRVPTKPIKRRAA